MAIMQFGQCRLFANRREFVVDGVPVPLSAASGRGSYVVEVNTLRVQIARVRRALGKDRGFLKTISECGYRFVAEAGSAAAAAAREGNTMAATTTEALGHECEKRTNLPAPASPLVDRKAGLSEVFRVVAAHRDRWRTSLRAIERRFKSLLMAALGSHMRRRGSREPPNWSAGPHRVLYLRYDRIGDMVLATGIIKAIVSAQPTVTVDVLASVGNAAVLRGNPYVESIYTIDKKRPWSYLTALLRIRRARYDAVVDAMVLNPSLTSILLMWASSARHRIGVAERGNDSALTMLVNRVQDAVHWVDRSSALLAAFGVDPQRSSAERRRALLTSSGTYPAARSSSPTTGWGIWRPELFLTPAELREGEARWHSADDKAPYRQGARRRLLVNVSASSRERYWPEKHFITTLIRIQMRFPDVLTLVIGSPDDAARMAQIARGAGALVAHTPHYRQMMAIVARSDLVFTADTSVTHIASAFWKPAVVMFVGGGGACWGPYGTAGHIISTDAPSLESTDVDPVIRALEALIAAERSSITDSTQLA
jgi:ADP-heptose:LPS heptosyltransferase